MTTKTNKGRRVKCKATGEYGNSNVFFKSPEDGYFKTEEIYTKWKEKIKYFQKAKDCIYFDFLGYKKGEPAPPNYIMKKFNELVEFYGSKIVYLTILECYDDIMWAVRNKEFQSYVGKVNYITAILKGRIRDVAAKEKKMQVKKARLQKAEVQADDLQEIKINQEVHAKKAKDLSSIIGEDDI